MAKSAKNKAAEEEPAEGSGDDTEAVAADEDEGGKKKSGSIRKSQATKRSTGKMKAVSGKHASVSAPKLSGAKLVPVVCSECHEELMYDTGAQGDLVCPICEHSANRPADAALHDMSGQLGSEKNLARIGVILFLLSTGLVTAWAVTSQNPANLQGNMFWGLMGTAIVCWLGLAAVSWKYESSRHECYF
jgi:hypothetical protein